MKKSVRLLSMLLVLATLCLCFASCGKISESYAEKINKAAEEKEYYTYEEVMEDLGKNAIDVTDSFTHTGFIVAVKGCENVDEIKDKIDADEEVKGIIVTFVTGNAMSATYKVITEDDLK